MKEALAAVDRHAIAARDQLRAVFLSGLDEAEHRLHLLLADDCSQPRLRIERIRRPHLRSTRHKLLGEFVFQLALEKQSRPGVADFAFAVEDAINRALHSAIDIGVGKHNVGRLAPKFQASRASAYRPPLA